MITQKYRKSTFILLILMLVLVGCRQVSHDQDKPILGTVHTIGARVDQSDNDPGKVKLFWYEITYKSGKIASNTKILASDLLVKSWNGKNAVLVSAYEVTQRKCILADAGHTDLEIITLPQPTAHYDTISSSDNWLVCSQLSGAIDMYRRRTHEHYHYDGYIGDAGEDTSNPVFYSFAKEAFYKITDRGTLIPMFRFKVSDARMNVKQLISSARMVYFNADKVYAIGKNNGRCIWSYNRVESYVDMARIQDRQWLMLSYDGTINKKNVVLSSTDGKIIGTPKWSPKDIVYGSQLSKDWLISVVKNYTGNTHL